MKTHTHRRAPGFAGVCATLLTLTLATATLRGDIEDRIEKSFTVKPGGQLTMDVDRGSIELITTDTETLHVLVIRKSSAGEERAKEAFANHQVNFQQTGDKVEITSQSKTSGILSQLWQRFQVEYKITLPKRFNADLKTAGGSIKVADIEGTIRLKTSGGSIHVGNVIGTLNGMTSGGSIAVAGCTGQTDVKTSGGSLDLGKFDSDLRGETSGGSISLKLAKGSAFIHTSGGSIRVEEALGKLDANTSGGSIQMKTLRGSTIAHTSGGSIRLEDVGGEIDAETSGGNVSASLTAQPKGNCRLRSSAGGVHVKLAEKLAFDLDAHCSAGRIRSDIPVTTTIQGEQRNHTLKGKINGGGPVLELRTSAGGIQIEKL